jgi:hypothetical protein
LQFNKKILFFANKKRNNKKIGIMSDGIEIEQIAESRPKKASFNTYIFSHFVD